MSEKFTPLKNRNCIILLSAFLIFSCKPKERFHWNVGISAPKNYPSGAPYAEFFYQGISINGAGVGTGAESGWGSTTGGISGGPDDRDVPDSVYVRWICGVDDWSYKQGFKLPREKMISLFKTGVTDPYGDHEDYREIVVGMAPGGNLCIWMKGGLALTEVARYKVAKGVEDSNIDSRYRLKDLSTSWGTYLAYWKIHGVPYSVWEKGEPEYKYDVGFISEDKSRANYDASVTGYSEDGTCIYTTNYGNTLNKVNWETKNGLKVDNPNNKLPVEIYIQWTSPNYKDWFETNIVLPRNFRAICQDFEKVNGAFVIVISMNPYTPNSTFNFGDVYLANTKIKQHIMHFRAVKLDNKNKTFGGSKISLPKNYQFPKFPGRHELKFPKLDYWQEP